MDFPIFAAVEKNNSHIPFPDTLCTINSCAGSWKAIVGANHDGGDNT